MTTRGAQPATFRLTVVAGAEAGTGRGFGERALLGTHPSADFVLDDPSVSRFHAEIRFADRRAVVADLGSRNGTMVDGVSVRSAHLAPGAVVALGRTQIRYDEEPGGPAAALPERTSFGGLVGRSPAMRAVFGLLERAAAADSAVLLAGETGTGKEEAARALHAAGRRHEGPFVVVDCGAIPPPLLASELFGHERGAFTGAAGARAGAFREADGGTLFLDEIGELAPDLQPMLLRALERHEVKRVGGGEYQRIDVRVIAASNRDLRSDVNAGRFRPDLYYRLAVVEIRLPPLRERRDDLPLLLEHLLGAEAATPPFAAPALRAALARHAWPGNVRELRNYLDRCRTFGQPTPLEPPATGDAASLVDAARPLKEQRERWIRAFEREYLGDLMRRHGDHATAAARAAGLDRGHFHRLLRRAGLR